MKRIIGIAAAFVLVFALAGCAGGSSASSTAASGSGSGAAAADYEVNYGESSMYTQEDMDAAIAVIMKEFDSWKGCTMKSISFTDDKKCTESVEYVNELKKDGSEDFDAAIVFTTDFHSPSKEEAEGTAWEPDTDYTGYEWYLARTGTGDWQLMTWGY